MPNVMLIVELQLRNHLLVLIVVLDVDKSCATGLDFVGIVISLV